MKPLRVLIIFLLAAITTVVVTEYRGDAWEQPLREVLFSLHHDSIPEYSTDVIDSVGVPYVIYHPLNGITAGKQYNPTIVANYALQYFEKGDTLHFQDCAKWLQTNLTLTNNIALYQFNWQQPWYDSVGVPYTSGMTSGLAIDVFLKASQAFHDTSFMVSAKQLLRGYFVPIRQGGFTYQYPLGWWYEELADTSMHTPFILDGHIFALLGPFHFWEVTHDDSAREVYEKGMAALKHSLPNYDSGNGWALYDKYRKPADKKYQRILTAQMKTLAANSKDPVFEHYYNAWKQPLGRPYVIRSFDERNRSAMVLIALVFAFFTFFYWLIFRLLGQNRKRP